MMDIPQGKANEAVQRVLDELVAQGKEIGVQVCAWLGEEQIVDCWAGLADPETGTPVDGNTLFNAYSVSKAVTATALHIQAERGLIEYDAPVADYWPEFALAGKGGRHGQACPKPRLRRAAHAA